MFMRLEINITEDKGKDIGLSLQQILLHKSYKLMCHLFKHKTKM